MPGGELCADFWMNEYITPWDIYAHGITRVIAHTRTEFQEMYVVETGAYGKALVLDGKWQSCTGDEFLYHEPLVHPAMLLHGEPRRVLILGGGEGATAREVLRWKGVEQCTMVDIDGEVVEACKEHLPEMHRGCFDDPRLDVVIDDALRFLDETRPEWDVIISDLSDPIEEGPSFKLFTKETFEKTRAALARGGAMVVQSGPVGPAEMNLHVRLAHTLGHVFENAHSYTSYVPTYASPWSFVLCSDRPIDTLPDPVAIDRRLSAHTTGGLRMFDGSAYLGMLQLPKHLRAAIAEETEVYTLARPPKFFGKGMSV
ncbi:MAG: spermidine synthase [Phycisphaerae bacterium]